MTIPLLSYHGVSTPGRGPENTTGVFFWVSAERQHLSAPRTLSLSGSSVDIWYDQSYYDHHLFGSGTARPVRVADDVTCVANTLDAVSFDGNDKLQSLEIPEASLEFNTQHQFAVHITFKAANNTDGTIFSIHDTGSGRDGISISVTPGGVAGRVTLGLNCGDTDAYVPTVFTIPAGVTYADGEVHSISLVYNQELPSSQLTLTIDGLQVAVSLNTVGLFASSKLITLGQYANTTDFPFTGKILEVIAQFVGDEDQRAIIYDYFQRKWCSN